MENAALGYRREAAGRLPLPLIGLGDERLARLVGRGNERAFSLLYQRYHQPLYRYLRSLLGQDADAQDALQSTFVAALGALREGRRDAPLRPWLFRIAHNHAISALRRRRPQSELTESLVSLSPPVEEQAAERERLGQLVADLRELSDRQRGALVMRELSGLTHEEIASALEISVGAAKQSVFEARRALTEFAEGRAMACEEIQRVISDGDKRALRGRRVLGHLRSCPGCAAFGASIETRRADLLALSPALPAAAASALLARTIAGAGFAHGFAQGGGGGGVVGGLAGKTAGVVASGKAFTAGVAVLATAAVGATGVVDQMGAHAGSARTASPGSASTDPGVARTVRGAGRAAPAPLDLRPGREAAGALGASGRVRQGSVAAGSVASASPGAAVSRMRVQSTSASVGARRRDQTAATRGNSSSAPGRIVSQSARARGNSVARRVTPARPGGRSGSARTQAAGAARSGRSAQGSAGARSAGAHHAAVPPAGAAAGTPSGAPSAGQRGAAHPGTAASK